jgi:hypothetical protein
MIRVKHNTNRKSDGKPMGASGQRASFIKYFFDACKGRTEEGLSPLVEYRKNDWHSAFAGAPTPIHVARVGINTYVVSVKRPAGRGGIAKGAKDVERHVTVWCPVDLQDFMKNITDRPEGVDISPTAI